MIQVRLSFILIISVLLLACKDTKKENTSTEDFSKLAYNGKKAGNNTLVVHELSDPDKLNPITSTGAGATYIEHNIFMYLLDIDKDKLEVIPWLAKERPTITSITEGEYAGGLKIDYELKPEAVWDNGSPITALDVAFAMKATMNPHVDSEHQRPYIEFIKEIKIDKENDKKFSFYTKEKNYAAEFSSGGTVHILPEYVYDPKQLMRQYTIKQLSEKESLNKIRDEIDLRQFAKDFNSEKYQREKISGSGAYEFVSWVTSERIILKKKANWWGEKYKSEKSFENHPDQIVYEIINDRVTATTAMRDEAIDLMRAVNPSDFVELLQNKAFNEKYYLKAEDQMSYTYIGVNMKNPILQEKNVRKALAHIVDVPQIIEIINYGYAKEISSFVHPNKSYYNKDLKPYDFDLQKAVAFLEAAGYTEFNDKGIRYKIENGERKTLNLSIKYNTGNNIRETIALFFKQNAKKAGIEIEVLGKEWTVYLDECKNHNFDMYVLGWVQEAVLDDPKQLFHTEMYNGGSNYTGFGDVASDKLIDSIRVEMNDEKRALMMKKLQAIVQDEVPYIFLFAPDNLIAINKRFENAKTYAARPGYDERELTLKMD